MKMKIKTSTRISIIFAIFTFFIVFIVLILLNSTSFLWWYNEEKDEVSNKIDKEYEEILEEYNDENTQKDELIKEVDELDWFSSDSIEFSLYNKIILHLYKKEEDFFILYEKNTKFWDFYLPYNVTVEYINQLRLIKIWFILLILSTFFSFLLAKFLFIKLALKDIMYISNFLKKINLDNIKKIDLDLNKNDEIKLVIDSINNFLSVIEKNTKNLKEFNTNVSHEFKTPLMVISSELEYLSISKNNKESYIKIEKQIDILNELLETFLLISKLENIKWNIKKDDILILDIINSQLSKYIPIYSNKNIKIKYIWNKNIKIKTNKKLFEVLIKNLIENSFKYNKNWWEITIDINNDYFIIKDTWIWIKKEDILKVFNTFYQVWDNSKWYWVWLNIVKKIANILNFKIELKSEINKWTEFKIIT